MGVRRVIGWLWIFLILVLSVTAGAAGVREAAVAGSWYPGDNKSLQIYLQGLLDQAEPKDSQRGRVRALITPHAGYQFSGAAAAEGYRLVQGRAYHRVIVLGPSHRARFRGISVADVSHYATPLGRIPLDAEALASLRGSELVTAHPDAHAREHSIEMQLPLLQQALAPGWRLLPILVGDMQAEDYRRLADLLRPLWDEHTLIVVSSDFTHYGRRFGYTPFPLDDKTPERIEGLDRGALEPILAGDAEGLLDYQRETGITVCGLRSIALLLHLLPERVQGSLLTYANSGSMTGDYGHAVSYLSIVFREVAEDRFSMSDMVFLHTLASLAVEAAARPDDPASMERIYTLLERIPPRLKQPAGAFVTLKREGKLRGCIGYILPRKPLYRTVLESGINAAIRDRRFPPLQAAELDELEIEVSVLTPPTAIASPMDFHPGQHGVILQKDQHSAVFLPEVATDQGWSREQTLSHLSRKAGLKSEDWKQGARFKVFHSLKYSAPYRQG